MFIGKDLLEFINNLNVVGDVKNELPMLTGPDPFQADAYHLKSGMATRDYRSH